jgi:hypothetical protein
MIGEWFFRLFVFAGFAAATNTISDSSLLATLEDFPLENCSLTPVCCTIYKALGKGALMLERFLERRGKETLNFDIENSSPIKKAREESKK